MKIKINNIQRMTGDMFDWYEAHLTLDDGTMLNVFYDIGDGDFRLFNAERLTWPERDDIRNRIMAVFHTMLSAEAMEQG